MIGRKPFLFAWLGSTAVGLAGAPDARAEVRVAAPVGAHMVIQRGRPVRLWGTAAAGESIRVALAAQSASTVADAAGRWKIALPALTAGGPFELTIDGSNRLRFGDVWVGEVWLASGQSNMELPLSRSTGAHDAVEGGCAGLRLYTVERSTAAAPQSQGKGAWQICDPETASAFSAVAFHFGREIHRTLGVPVGLIQAAWGGTPAEAWTPRDALVASPTLEPMVDALDRAISDPQVKAEAARKLRDWEAHNFYRDTGNRGEVLGYARPARSVAGWTKMQLPQRWEDAGLAIDGAVWFRREVVVPDDWAGADLDLSLGPLDDFDVTYWNGERVGETGAETPEYYAVPRRYPVPGRLVHAGRNVVAVRVFDHYGSGGFAGSAGQMTLGRKDGGASLPLAGTWLYKIERRLPPIVADFNSRPVVPGVDDSNSPTVIWNAMLAPLATVPLAGVIWYQGESNVVHAAQYRTLFPTMIRAWRAAWGAPALPFVFVQLPNFDDGATAPVPGASAWAELREAQAMALQLPKTAMAVTLDIGESRNLHPRNKQEVGRRLALGALQVAYGKDVIAVGPTFRSASREGAALRVRFDAVAGGLTTIDGAPPRGFVVAGADRTWHPAEAKIEGAAVVVSSPEVADPVAVRYGWGNDPVNTLRSQADLPAAPFRTDDW